METIARVPEPIQWSEGMPLAPQHFQQSDIYWQALLQHQMVQLEPHYWGVLNLKLDEAAIRMGKIVVLELHAVMPDGLIVQYPAPGQDGALEIDVATDPSLRENKPLLIQLAAPVRAEGAASRASSIQRFDSLPGSLERDENTGEGRVPVGRLRVRLTLQAGEQLPAKYIALPLLQLRRDFGGHFDLTEYHPPLLRLGAARFLGEGSLQKQLQALAVRIRRKAKELIGATDETAPSISNNYQRQIVRHLVAALPEFELLVRTPTAHPFRCYLALANLIGSMAALGSDPIPMMMASYRHNDAAPGFLQAIRHLSAAVAKLNAAYTAVAFEHARENVFTCELPQGLRPDRLIVEIKPSNEQGMQAAAQWLRQATIGSSALIPLLRQRRVAGGRVRPLSATQRASLGVQNGGFYEIANQPIQQDERLLPVIQKDTVLHIEGPANGAAPANIVLYVPNDVSNRDAHTEADADAAGAKHG